MSMAIKNAATKQSVQNPNSSSVLIQGKCDCGGLSKLGRGCAECNRKKLTGAQTKLKIGAANDHYEHEADRIADQVMRITHVSEVTAAPVQVSRHEVSTTSAPTSPPLNVERTVTRSGRSLESPVQQDMEQRFGRDFSGVRIHTDAYAANSAADINARAYTVGNNIVFARGAYKPYTNNGRKLLAHELTHTLQQQNKSNLLQKQGGDDDLAETTSTNSSGETTGSSMEVVRPESEPRIVFSCADMRFKIHTPRTIYSYRLEECSMPLGSYIAGVTVTDNDFYLNFSDAASADESFSFRYRVEPGEENPATLLSEIDSIQVDVVESLAAPQPRTQQQRTPAPTNCVVRLDDRTLIPSDRFSKALFSPKSYEQTIWSQPIPLGQFGWIELEASAKGSLSGNFNANYGPGRLTDICITHSTDRNTTITEDGIPLIGSRVTESTTVNLGGRARFSLPASAIARVAASGEVKIAGDALSAIELAAARAELSANAIARLSGAINASVDIVASATFSRTDLEAGSLMRPAGYPPFVPLGVVIENVELDSVDLAAEIGLRGNAGVSFRGDLTAGFDLLGVNLWSQTWNLANFNAGINWAGGLRYSPNPGLHWDLGSFSIAGEDENEISPLSSDINEDEAEMDENEVINALLDEEHAQVDSPDGSSEDRALPFDWYKPDGLYPGEMTLPNAISPNSVGRFAGPTPVRFPANLVPRRDRPVYGLPRSPVPDPSTEVEEYIGVADWPSVHRTFQYLPYDGRSDPEKERFKRLVDELGFSRSGFDADHIWEIGLMGLEYDRFDNLWPGSNQEQQLAGSLHNIQIRNYRNTLGNVNGRWLEIVRIRHPASYGQ